jgi:hypothetical protein
VKAVMRITGYVLLFVLIGGCSKSSPIIEYSVTPPQSELASPSPAVTAHSLTAVPSLEPTALPPKGRLTILSPLETIVLYGGGELRVALSLQEPDGRPLEAAIVQVELWSPGGVRFMNLPMEDNGQGRYLGKTISLPLSGAGGDWRVVAQASWGDGGHAYAEGVFTVRPSISETYQELYGFWIEPPSIHGLGTGFYNLQGGGGLHFEDWLEEDGGGYVILDNYRYQATGVTYLTLEVHWQPIDYPGDEATVIAHALDLGEKGLHHRDLESNITDFVAIRTTFQGFPAWKVVGQYRESYTANSAVLRPAEWIIFQCPGSDWTWSLLITSDKSNYMNYLRSQRNTFICPPSG